MDFHQKKSSNRRALGIEGWGTKFSGGKLRTWWFWTDSTMVKHYSTTIWGNINCFFSQTFFPANPRQDGSDMKFEVRQHNYFTCIGINYMILYLWIALAIITLFGDCRHESFEVEITKQSIFFIEILCKFLLSQVCTIKTQKRCSTIFPSGNLSV